MVKTYPKTVQDRMIQFLQSKVGSKHGWKKKAAEFLGLDNPQNLTVWQGN